MTSPTNEIALGTLAAKIRIEHEAVRLAAETATEHAIRCGRLLAEAKDGLVHGQWLSWLKDHCSLSDRTAQAYMRLAKKCAELNDRKAQRVADLPVRQAMKAIADERGENPVPLTPYRCAPPKAERVWEWAEKQVNGPFNMFDFDNAKLARDKLLRQTGVSTVAAFCISTMTEEIPMLRIVPDGELSDAIRCLAPVAQGNCGGLDIDFDDIPSKLPSFIAMLTVTAQWTIGKLLREIDCRHDAYKSTSPKKYAERRGRDFNGVCAAFLENCNANLAELRAAP